MGLGKIGSQFVTIGGARAAELLNINMNGLSVYYDAANLNSYPQSGTTWFDLTINKNHGALVNGPTFSADNGGGITFNGSNHHHRAGLVNIPVQGPGTVCIVAKYTNLSNVRNLFTLTSSSVGIQIGIRNNVGTIWKFGGASLLNYDMPILDAISQWSMAFDGPNIRMFVNGVLNASTSAAANQSGTTPRLYLCTYQDAGSEAFSGTIYQMLLYDRVLSASEILNNFNAVRGRFGI